LRPTSPSILLWVLTFVPTCCLVLGCGASPGIQASSPYTKPPASGLILVVLSPSSGNLTPGQSQQLTAVVTGSSNQGLTWEINGTAGDSSSIGTISSTGLYTAPSAAPKGGTVTVTAISAVDGASSGTAVFTIRDSVAVNPSSATLATGEAYQFAALVNGSTNSAEQWEVNGIAGGNIELGTVTSSGLYTAPEVAPTTAVTLTAVYGMASASAAVQVFDPEIEATHNRWLEGVAAAAATYGCSDISVQQQATESLADVIEAFDLTANEGSCLVLWPVSTDSASLRYSFAWGGTIGGKNLLYISDIGEMRIWNGIPLADGSGSTASISAEEVGAGNMQAQRGAL
jgi:hypothetical protein